MKATIIIPTAGHRIEYLNDTLVSVKNQDFFVQEYEVIVIDNSKGEKVAEAVKRINQTGRCLVRYIREEDPGLHNARHAGAKEAKGDILVYIDDDVILPSHWLVAILDPFSDPKVGCSGGKVIPQWEAEIPSWFSQFNKAYLSLLDYGENRKELKAPGIWGCNMAVRKAAFFEVGGSNVDFFADESLIWFSGDGECGLEDRLLDAGYKIIYEPLAWLYHRIPASRLTPEYFYNRFIFTGIHQSYTRIRKEHKNFLFFVSLPVFAICDLLKSGYRYVESMLDKSRSIKLRADSYRFCSRARHALLAIFSKKLRDHVIRDSYL